MMIRGIWSVPDFASGTVRPGGSEGRCAPSSTGARCAGIRCMRLATRASSPSSSQRSMERRKVRSHPPASRSASSCAGGRTCQAPRVSSHLVRRAHSGESPPVLVSGPWGACSVPIRSDNPCAAAPDRLFALDKALHGYRHAVRISVTFRAGTGCTDLRPAPQLGSCSANPGTERGLAPERKPPWTHRLDSPRYPPPSRRGRWPSPTPRPHGLARSPGALAHRWVRSGHHGAGRLRAAPTHLGRRGADTSRPGRRAPAS